MVAGTIPVRTAFVVSQPAQDEAILLARLRRLQNGREIEAFAFTLRDPIRHVHPVGQINESHPFGKALGRGGGRSSPRNGRGHGFKQRQSHRRPESFEESPSWYSPRFIHRTI